MSSYFPHDRQRALYSLVEYVEKPFQRATNASARYFRINFRLITYTYLILLTISVLEWLSHVMGIGAFGRESQYASIGNTLLITVLSATFSLSHYYIYMIYGHGYQDPKAQFYVDKYSSIGECKSSMGLMRSFYGFSLLTGVGTLAACWLTAKSTWHEQVLSLRNFLDVTYFNAALSEFNISDSSQYSNSLVVYNWVVTAIALVVVLLAILGIIQTLLARVKE